MEILFYHLTESRVDDALPALLERSIERNWRVTVQTTTDERCEALDTHLWTFRPDSFLPHGMDRDPHADLQPILLTTSAANQNNAGVRFVIDGASRTVAAPFALDWPLAPGHHLLRVEAEGLGSDGVEITVE